MCTADISRYLTPSFRLTLGDAIGWWLVVRHVFVVMGVVDFGQQGRLPLRAWGACRCLRDSEKYNTRGVVLSPQPEAFRKSSGPSTVLLHRTVVVRPLTPQNSPAIRRN